MVVSTFSVVEVDLVVRELESAASEPAAVGQLRRGRLGVQLSERRRGRGEFALFFFSRTLSASSHHDGCVVLSALAPVAPALCALAVRPSRRQHGVSQPIAARGAILGEISRRRALHPSLKLVAQNLRVGTIAAAAAAAAAAATLATAPASCDARTTAKADALFDAAKYSELTALLQAELNKATPGSADAGELSWRLARAMKKSADAEKTKDTKKALVFDALKHAERALELVPEIGAAHKWYAILLSESGSFAGTSASIKNSFVVREHFERAAALSPKDATSRHLLGLWCFEVAKLSWIEQKAAAALFATPPTATFAEALDHFEHAERIEPGFYPKNLLLTAQALSRLGRADEAKAALAKCLAATPKSPEDEATLEEARKLKL